MHYGHTSETDWTITPVRRDLSRISVRVAERIAARLALPPFDRVDWQLIYAPIIMGPVLAPSYPARSRCRHKARELGCAPQLDQPGFVAGPCTGRWRIYVGGLHDTEMLMRRAKFPREVIDVFRGYVETLAATPDC